MKKLSLLFNLLFVSTFIFSQNQINAFENLKKRGESVVRFESATVTDIDGNIYHTIKVGKQTWMFENLQTTRYNDGTKIDVVNTLINRRYENGMLIESKNNLGGRIVGRYYKFNLAGCDGIYEGTITKGVLYNYAAMNSNKLCPVGWHVPTDNDWLIFIKTFCKSDKYESDVKLTSLGEEKFEKEFNGNYVCSASSGGGLFFTSPNHAWSKAGGHLWSSSGKYLYYFRGDNTSGVGYCLGLDENRNEGIYYSYCVRCIKDEN